jgi:tight adherence protein B
LPIFLYQGLSAVALGLLFGSFPLLYVRYKRHRRLAEFEKQFPEALDFMARSMRAGHAFSISLEMMGQESPDPLGQEFRVAFNEQNLGAPLEVALASLTARVPLLDVRFFVSTVLLQRQTGGNLSEILLRLSYIIRERFRLRGQVRAASAHGRITATILGTMPIVVAILMMVVAPSYIPSMIQDADGRWLLLGSIAIQILGYFWMRSIINIKV